MKAQRSARTFAIADGLLVLPHSLVLLQRTGTLIAADAHFGYEDVIGGALPLWSTASSLAVLQAAIARTSARELVLLGDIIHGSAMSDGAARTVRAALDALREVCELVLVAGNHEGRTRGAAVLGDTVESCVRDGWLLAHGDVPSPTRSIVGHLHPSLRLGSGSSIPVALAHERLAVVPALTPYSEGLDVTSRACARALRAFGAECDAMQLVASDDERVFPFGSLGEMRALLASARAREGPAALRRPSRASSCARR